MRKECSRQREEQMPGSKKKNPPAQVNEQVQGAERNST